MANAVALQILRRQVITLLSIERELISEPNPNPPKKIKKAPNGKQA